MKVEFLHIVNPVQEHTWHFDLDQIPRLDEYVLLDDEAFEVKEVLYSPDEEKCQISVRELASEQSKVIKE